MFYENIKNWLKQEAQSPGDDSSYREFLEKALRAADELLDELDEGKDWKYTGFSWPKLNSTSGE